MGAVPTALSLALAGMIRLQEDAQLGMLLALAVLVFRVLTGLRQSPATFLVWFCALVFLVPLGVVWRVGGWSLRIEVLSVAVVNVRWPPSPVRSGRSP